MYQKPMGTNGLDDLLSRDSRAKEYFMALGECPQGMLRQCSYQIETFEDMQKRAQSLSF